MINIKNIAVDLDKKIQWYKKILLNNFNLKKKFNSERYYYFTNELQFRYLSEYVKKYNPKLVVDPGNRQGISALSLVNESSRNNNTISVDRVKQKSFVDKKNYEDRN